MNTENKPCEKTPPLKERTSNQVLLAFQQRQGDVPIGEAMLAFNQETKAFAVIRHPSAPGLFREIGVTSDVGAKWLSWKVKADGRTRTTDEIVANLNAEVLAILLAGEADPKLVRQALAFIPEWESRFGEGAPWPYWENE